MQEAELGDELEYFEEGEQAQGDEERGYFDENLDDEGISLHEKISQKPWNKKKVRYSNHSFIIYPKAR